MGGREKRADPIVVKVRRGDRVMENTRRRASHLPLLGARGHPIPVILRRGMAGLDGPAHHRRRLVSGAVSRGARWILRVTVRADTLCADDLISVLAAG